MSARAASYTPPDVLAVAIATPECHDDPTSQVLQEKRPRSPKRAATNQKAATAGDTLEGIAATSAALP